VADKRNQEYTYLATRRSGNRTAIVAKTVKETNPPDPVASRLKTIDLMMKRLYGGVPSKQLAAEAGIGVSSVDARLAKAREMGVPEIARDIFLKEFLPASMAVLQEALYGKDLKLATQVALKVVAGLEVMEDPAKAEIKQAEPESLEIWRAKFVKKPAVEVKAISSRRIDESLDVTNDRNEERESASHSIPEVDENEC
jgi:hypothetical protein